VSSLLPELSSSFFSELVSLRTSDINEEAEFIFPSPLFEESSSSTTIVVLSATFSSFFLGLRDLRNFLSSFYLFKTWSFDKVMAEDLSLLKIALLLTFLTLV